VMQSAAVSFDDARMRRYDREGPRYTSYPTAQQFAEGIAPKAYELAATTSHGALSGQPLAAYIHVPFCASPCFYCGCNKILSRKLDRIEAYVGHLQSEISLRGYLFDKSRVMDQLHFGGGTPTYLPGELLIRIVERLGREFQLTDALDRDYSIEIDPRSIEQGTLPLLASLGFNRISLGVQDFDERVQRAVNRVQPAAMVATVYEEARRLEFRSINFDLIYGLPMQSVSSFGATLDRVVSMRPDRLAVYAYAHMPRLFKAQRQIRNDELPDAGERLLLLQLAVNKLGEAGYEYIGMDHFALPGDSLARARKNRTLHRSFQGYTTHAERDLVSFGVSAIGRVGDLYVQNHKLPQAYEGALAKGILPTNRGISMNRDDHIRKEIIDGIMCQGFVDIATIEGRHGIDFAQYFGREQERLQVLQADGLISLDSGSITLTGVGRLLMRTVAMTFDAYTSLAKPAAMSRVI